VEHYPPICVCFPVHTGGGEDRAEEGGARARVRQAWRPPRGHAAPGEVSSLLQPL